MLARSLCLEEVISMRDFMLRGSGKADMNPKSLPMDRVIGKGKQEGEKLRMRM